MAREDTEVNASRLFISLRSKLWRQKDAEVQLFAFDLNLRDVAIMVSVHTFVSRCIGAVGRSVHGVLCRGGEAKVFEAVIKSVSVSVVNQFPPGYFPVNVNPSHACGLIFCPRDFNGPAVTSRNAASRFPRVLGIPASRWVIQPRPLQPSENTSFWAVTQDRLDHLLREHRFSENQWRKLLW